MRVVIDRALCGGHGASMDAVPEVFLVVERAGDLSQATLVLEAPPDALRPKLEVAVRGCPNGALTLVD